MITLKDIAEITGVSISTVSRIMSNKGKISQETKKKVLAAVEEFMFKPGVVSQKFEGAPRKLSIIIPEHGEYYHDDPTSSADLRPLMKGAGEDVVILKHENNPDFEKKLIKRILDEKIEGVVFSDPFNNNYLITEIIQEL